MLQTLTYKANVAPEGVPPVIRLSQNENGRVLIFDLVGTGTVNIPTGSVVTISGTKPDGVVYSAEGTLDGTSATFDEDTQMTAVAGEWPAKLRVTYDGETIASVKIWFAIDADPVRPGSVPSESELNGLVAEAQQYAESARSAAYGSPLTASTAADMTNTDKVYVYTGSESGYLYGHWYYYNGTAWTDGGVYQSQGVQTDPTLTLEGVPADAKATGGRIGAAEEDVADLKDALSDVYLTDIYNVSQYGTIYHAFNFIAGHTYELTNKTNGAANAYTFSEASSSGTQIEIIKENWSAGSTIVFTPSQNASAIKTYTDAAGKITIVDLSIGVPKLKDDVTNLQENFSLVDMSKACAPTSDFLTFVESKYAGNSGYTNSNQYDSWEFLATQDMTIYMSKIGSTSAGMYMQLCVYPSGSFNDPDYARYRSSESNLPSSANPLSVTSGTKLIISTNKDNSTWGYVISGLFKSLSNDVSLNTAQVKQASSMYHVTYKNGVLHVNGNGIDCNFSDLNFESNHGVFELQNLTYNNHVIFGTNNDYLGPVRVNGESIKGAKHGDELTDSLVIIADGNVLSDGADIIVKEVTIFVESTISTDEFKRHTVWSISHEKLVVNSIIKTLKSLSIDYVFGTGIISSQDDVTVAWLNKDVLDTDVLIGLNPITNIVTNGGTLVSKRISVNSSYGDQRIAFSVYTGRKKLYYYNCYGNNISVPSNAIFASVSELEFM